MELLPLLQIVVQERQHEQLQHVQRHDRRLETKQKRLEGQADAGRTVLHGGYIQPKGKSSPTVTVPALCSRAGKCLAHRAAFQLGGCRNYGRCS